MTIKSCKEWVPIKVSLKKIFLFNLLIFFDQSCVFMCRATTKTFKFKDQPKKESSLFQIIALSQTQMHCTHLLPNMSLIFSKIGKRSRICVRSPLPPNIFIPFFLFFLRLRSSESELMFAIRFQCCVQCSFRSIYRWLGR